MSISSNYTSTGYVPTSTSNVSCASGASGASGSSGACGASGVTATSGVATRSSATYTAQAPETQLTATGPTSSNVTSSPEVGGPEDTFYRGRQRTYYRNENGEYAPDPSGPWLKDWPAMCSYWAQKDWEDSFMPGTSVNAPDTVDPNYIDPALEQTANECASLTSDFIEWCKSADSSVLSGATGISLDFVTGIKLGNFSRDLEAWENLKNALQQVKTISATASKSEIVNMIKGVGTAFSVIAIVSDVGQGLASDSSAERNENFKDAGVNAVKLGIATKGGPVGGLCMFVNELISFCTGVDPLGTFITAIYRTIQDPSLIGVGIEYLGENPIMRLR